MNVKRCFNLMAFWRIWPAEPRVLCWGRHRSSSVLRWPVAVRSRWRWFVQYCFQGSCVMAEMWWQKRRRQMQLKCRDWDLKCNHSAQIDKWFNQRKALNHQARHLLRLDTLQCQIIMQQSGWMSNGPPFYNHMQTMMDYNMPGPGVSILGHITELEHPESVLHASNLDTKYYKYVRCPSNGIVLLFG